ncbi:MAG: cell wall-binding protein associated metalloendopeptidase, partial [Pseudobdellovibrio sp.]|nr:cell wall-binding protein associated metalloendopeptidase [Pseudobdellovibrio sp.]
VLTRYAHNSQIFVQVGQKISKYDVISATGSTGRSTGPHLHYEVRVNGIPVDPANYILDE